MSLTTNGVWKAGVWATTVWADGVWREGSGPTPPAPTPPANEQFSGGFLTAPRRRDRDELAKDRERYGIPAEVADVIAEVAVRQAKSQEVDEQKRFEELERELALRSIEWRGSYLAALNERLEIERRKKNLALILLLTAAI